MEELISFIRKNNLHSMRDIILHKMKEYTTIIKSSIDIRIEFSVEGNLKYIKLSTDSSKVEFKNQTDLYSFLFINEVFESRGKHLLRKYIEQHKIKTIQEFIKEYSNFDKVVLFLTNKSIFTIKLSFGKNFCVNGVSFIDMEGNEYAKLSSEEFYEVINELKINK